MLGALVLASAAGYILAPQPLASGAHRAPSPLMAPPPPPVKSGYYKRPSAALEQGGAFYVPGLEGSRLRVAAASVLSVGLVLNRVLSQGEPVGSQLVSEVLGAIGCAIIFVQAAQQAQVEKELERDALRAAFASRMSELQEVGGALKEDAPRAARARWAAGALLRVTPARAVVWLDDAATSDAVLLRFGRFPEGEGAPLAPRATALRALLPAGATSVLIDALDDPPPPPLPANAESAALCVCGTGVLALASERAGAFTEKQRGFLEQCCKLLDAP